MIPPNECRSFFHKKDSFLRKIARHIPVVGAAVDFLPDFGGSQPRTPRRDVPIPGAIGAVQRFLPGGATGYAQPGCPPNFYDDGRGNCVPRPTIRPVVHPAARPQMYQPVQRVPGVVGAAQRFLPGGATGYQVGPSTDPTYSGEVVMGIYGAAEVPGRRMIDRHVCRPGMVLGDDMLCYNRTQIRNSDREWPRGTRPLGTPGEMAALRTSVRFAGRMDRTNVRLQSLGLLKKPTRSRPKKKHTISHTH